MGPRNGKGRHSLSLWWLGSGFLRHPGLWELRASHVFTGAPAVTSTTLSKGLAVCGAHPCQPFLPAPGGEQRFFLIKCVLCAPAFRHQNTAFRHMCKIVFAFI